MINNPATRGRAGCPVCGEPHAVCGPPVAAEAEKRAVDQPKMLVRSGQRVAEEDTTQEQPETLHKYRVRLDGNRGETVMKLTSKEAEQMGDRVLEDMGEAKMYGLPEDETKHADQTASSTSPAEEDEQRRTAEAEEQEKARQTATKQRSPRNK